MTGVLVLAALVGCAADASTDRAAPDLSSVPSAAEATPDAGASTGTDATLPPDEQGASAAGDDAATDFDGGDLCALLESFPNSATLLGEEPSVAAPRSTDYEEPTYGCQLTTGYDPGRPAINAHVQDTRVTWEEYRENGCMEGRQGESEEMTLAGRPAIVRFCTEAASDQLPAYYQGLVILQVRETEWGTYTAEYQLGTWGGEFDRDLFLRSAEEALAAIPHVN